MGFNLLGVLPLRFPSIDLDARGLRLPPVLEAYAVGVTFALAASPCSTPVLTSLLAWVGASGDPVQGGALLLTYSVGYVAPLLAAAASTVWSLLLVSWSMFHGRYTRRHHTQGVMSQLLSLRGKSDWVPTASGVLLVAGGTYTLLTRLVVV